MNPLYHAPAYTYVPFHGFPQCFSKPLMVTRYFAILLATYSKEHHVHTGISHEVDYKCTKKLAPRGHPRGSKSGISGPVVG